MNKARPVSILFAFFVLLFTGCVPNPQPVLSVHFIDVGQGDSILVDLGDTEVLVDGGEIYPGVVDYIRPYVQGNLEAVIATHPHDDHIGGLIAVLQKFHVDQVWINGDNITSKNYADFLSLAYARDAETRIALRGNSIHAGSLNFQILNPGQPLTMDINNNSIVLNLKYGNTDFLFTGDAGSIAEAEMLRSTSLQLPHVDILKVGHHGSNSATSQEFLNIIRPEVAVYEAGAGNDYGHPHQEVINRLKAGGIKIYGTDKNGNIVVTSDGNSYKVSAQKGTYQN